MEALHLYYVMGRGAKSGVPLDVAPRVCSAEGCGQFVAPPRPGSARDGYYCVTHRRLSEEAKRERHNAERRKGVYGATCVECGSAPAWHAKSPYCRDCREKVSKAKRRENNRRARRRRGQGVLDPLRLCKGCGERPPRSLRAHYCTECIPDYRAHYMTSRKREVARLRRERGADLVAAAIRELDHALVLHASGEELPWLRIRTVGRILSDAKASR